MQPGLAEFLEKYSVSGVRAYVLAICILLLATLIRSLLNPYVGASAPFAIHAIAVLVVASLAGRGPAMVAVVVAASLGWFYLIPDELPLSQRVAQIFSLVVAGSVLAFVTATMRSALITAARSRRETDFLSREMHHRVKNLFAVVGSMMTLSAREQPAAREALTELRSRLQALSDAHDVAINSTDYICLPDLVERLMGPHVANAPGQPRVLISGERVQLPAGYTTPLGLILNELTTNAVKYGSLGTRRGLVDLSWILRDDMLELRWKETGNATGAAPEVGSPGFGSLLVAASVAQLRGTIDRNLTDEGLIVRLSMPLPEAQQKQFRSVDAGASQDTCNPPQSSLSALRGSRRFFRRRPRIRDSRS